MANFIPHPEVPGKAGPRRIAPDAAVPFEAPRIAGHLRVRNNGEFAGEENARLPHA